MRWRIFLLTLLLSRAASAGTVLEWTGDVSAGGVADDNWLFNEQNIESVGFDTRASGRLHVSTPRHSLALESTVLHREFESHELPDAEEYGVSATGAREHTFGTDRLTVGYRRRDTLLGVVEADGPAATNEEESTTFVSVGTSRELSSRAKANLNVSASRVRYNAPTPERNDFDYGSGGIGIDYELSEDLVGSLSILADLYETESSPVTVCIPVTPTQCILFQGERSESAVSVGPGVGLTYDMTERDRLSFDLSARNRWNTTELSFAGGGLPDQTIDEDEPEYLGRVAYTRAYDRGTAQVSLGRDVVPSSLGRLRNRDSAGIYVTRELSPVSSMSFAASLMLDQEETSYLSGGRVVLEDRDSVNTEVSYSRKFAENVGLTAVYRYRTESSKGIDRVTSNGIFVTASYEFGARR